MTNRTLIGDFGGGDYRIRVSKPGFDVTAALDPERLAFDSAWKDGAVIYAIGSVVYPGGQTSYVEVPFGETMPNIPFVYAWRYDSGTSLTICDVLTIDTNYRSYITPVASETSLRFYGALRNSGNTAYQAYTAGYIILRGMADG